MFVALVTIWSFPKIGLSQKLDGLEGKIPLKWMMTGGSPLLGHQYIYIYNILNQATGGPPGHGHVVSLHSFIPVVGDRDV